MTNAKSELLKIWKRGNYIMKMMKKRPRLKNKITNAKSYVIELICHLFKKNFADKID